MICMSLLLIDPLYLPPGGRIGNCYFLLQIISFQHLFFLSSPRFSVSSSCTPWFQFSFNHREHSVLHRGPQSLLFLYIIFHQLLFVSFYYLFFVLLLRVSLCLLRVLRGFSFLLTTESTVSFTEVHRVFYLFILYFINFLLLAFNILFLSFFSAFLCVFFVYFAFKF